MYDKCGCSGEKPDMSEEIERFEKIIEEIRNLAYEALCLLPPVSYRPMIRECSEIVQKLIGILRSPEPSTVAPRCTAWKTQRKNSRKNTAILTKKIPMTITSRKPDR